MDSNPRSPARETTLQDCLLIEEVRFALDSPLEGTGFEPSVPRQQWSSVQLAARDGNDAAIAKPGTPVVRVDERGRAISQSCRFA